MLSDRQINDLEDKILAMSTGIAAATYQILTLVRQLDEGGGFRGYDSPARWLAIKTGITMGPAREKVRVARAIANLPATSAAFERGQLTYSKVRALTRIADQNNEAGLVEAAVKMTASDVERMVREWRQAGAKPASNRRYLALHVRGDGLYEVRGRLTPEVGALLSNALDAAQHQLTRERGVEESRVSRAEALRVILEERVRSMVEVVMHQMEGGPVMTTEGLPVSAGTAERLACDAATTKMTRSQNGSVLDVGRRSRAVPGRLRKAVEARDKHSCRFPSCLQKRNLHIHHIRPWAQGGETNLDNLVLLCGQHHRLVHESRWSVSVEDADLVFRDPLGRQCPAPPLVKYSWPSPLMGGGLAPLGDSS